MHEEFPHWNSLGPQEDGAHSTSSEPSPQSSSLLHTKFREMQRPLAHVNSFGAHVMFPGEGYGKNVSVLWKDWQHRIFNAVTVIRHFFLKLEFFYDLCLLLLQLKNNKLNLISFKPQPYFVSLDKQQRTCLRLTSTMSRFSWSKTFVTWTHTDRVLKSSHRAELSQQLAVCLLMTSIQNIQYWKYCILCLQVQLDDQFAAIFKTSTAKPIMCAPLCFL